MNDAWQGVKALIAEDHELYRDGLKILLQETIPDIQVYIAPDFPDALSILKEHSDIALVLLDLNLPGTQSLDGLKEIRGLFPTAIVIVVSTLDFDITTRQIIDLGANGFIAKSTQKAEMKLAIEDILNGNLAVRTESSIGQNVELSQRLLDTLQFMAMGLSNKEIAIKMNISPLTAKDYVSKIIYRLNAENRMQAVLKAQQNGLLLSHYFK